MALGNGVGGGAGGGEADVGRVVEKAECGEAGEERGVGTAGVQNAAGRRAGGVEGSPSAPLASSFSPLPALTWSHAETRAMLLETLGEAALSALERAVPTPPLQTVFRCVPARGSAAEAAALLSARTRAQLSGPAREHDLLPGVLVMPGSGPHRLAADLSAPAPGEIALDQRAAEAILRGADPFVPGVVAVSAGLEAGDTVLITAAEVPRREQDGGEGEGVGEDEVGEGSGGGGEAAHRRGQGGNEERGQGKTGTFTVLTKGAVLEKPSVKGWGGRAVAGKNGGGEGARADDDGKGDGEGAGAAAVATAGGDFSSTLPADLLTPRLLLATGVAALSRSEILHARSGLAATCSSRLFHAPALGGGELTGRGMLQNLPSIAAARALRPEPHWKILDACASPGGKSTAIAEMLDASRGGLVVSLDRTHGKVADIRRLAAELGLSGVVRAFRADATKLFAREEVEERLRGGQVKESGQGNESEGKSAAPGVAGPRGGSTDPRGKAPRAQGLAAGQEHAPAPASNGIPETRREKKRERGTETRSAQAPASPVGAHAPASGEPASDPPSGPPDAASLSTTGSADEGSSNSPRPPPALPASSASTLPSPPSPHVVAKRSRPSERAVAREARREANRVRHGHAPAAAPDREPLLPPQTLESFDAALVDAPCSGVGQRPRLAVPHSVRELAVAAAYQKRILRQAVYALKPGGALVFSTCTVSPFENECNVRWLLDEFPDVLALEDARPEDPEGAEGGGNGPTRRLGRPGLVGERTVAGLDVAWLQERPAKAPPASARQAAATTPPSSSPPTPVAPSPSPPAALSGTVRLLTEREAPLVRRFDPGMGDDDVIGFFCARFRKRASCFV